MVVVRRAFLKTKAASITIASAWRVRVKSLSLATTVISAYWRGSAQRQRFRALRRIARLKLVREEVEHEAMARESFKAAVRVRQGARLLSLINSSSLPDSLPFFLRLTFEYRVRS
jgi:hypothetical protein